MAVKLLYGTMVKKKKPKPKLLIPEAYRKDPRMRAAAWRGMMKAVLWRQKELAKQQEAERTKKVAAEKESYRRKKATKALDVAEKDRIWARERQVTADKLAAQARLEAKDKALFALKDETAKRSGELMSFGDPELIQQSEQYWSQLKKNPKFDEVARLRAWRLKLHDLIGKAKNRKMIREKAEAKAKAEEERRRYAAFEDRAYRNYDSAVAEAKRPARWLEMQQKLEAEWAKTAYSKKELAELRAQSKKDMAELKQQELAFAQETLDNELAATRKRFGLPPAPQPPEEPPQPETQGFGLPFPPSPQPPPEAEQPQQAGGTAWGDGFRDTAPSLSVATEEEVRDAFAQANGDRTKAEKILNARGLTAEF